MATKSDIQREQILLNSVQNSALFIGPKPGPNDAHKPPLEQHKRLWGKFTPFSGKRFRPGKGQVREAGVWTRVSVSQPNFLCQL